MARGDSAAKNTTDLRRARQRARSVITDIEQVIIEFLESDGIQIWQNRTATPRQRMNRINQQITLLAARQIQIKLGSWLRDRRKTTMARAARAAFQDMQGVLPGTHQDIDLFSSPNLRPRDIALNREMEQIDAALLYNRDTDSIATKIGNEATRQIRIGFSQNQPISSTNPDVDTIADRVQQVLSDADQDTRDAHGITGQTIRSRAELIAHDSIQDAYVSSATRRYLNNGFRYAVYDAVVDHRTSHVCRRLDEVVIDMVETPWLIPPNHPWCRSDIRPILDLGEGQEPISETDIGDRHLKQIWGTNGFRPKVIDTDQEFNPTVLNELLPGAGT